MKVKGFLLDLRWTTAKEAATLDRWMHSQVHKSLGHCVVPLFRAVQNSVTAQSLHDADERCGDAA